MLRTVSVLASTLFVLAALPGTAQAATVVNNEGDPLTPWTTGTATCDDLDTGTASLQHVSGPTANADVGPPLGSGSLRIRTGPSESRLELARDFSGTPPLATALTAFSLSTYQPAVAPAAVETAMAFTLPNNDTVILNQFLPTTGWWTTTDVLESDMVWREFANGGLVATGHGNYAAYLAAYDGGGHLTGVFIDVDNCGTGGADERSYLDGLRLAVTGDSDTTFDFEGNTPGISTSSFAMTGSATTIKAGKTVAIAGTLLAGGAPVGGEPATLWAKQAGATTFSQVAAVTTSAAGVARSVEKPTANTVYQWRFAGDDAATTATSANRSVTVATNVTMNVADVTVAAGQHLVAHGLVFPGKAGQTVTLKRHTSAGDKSIGSATVQSDGTWVVSKALAKGSYKLFAAVAADADNAAGRSRRITVTAS